MDEYIEPKGSLKIWSVKGGNEKVELLVDKSNLIVTGGKNLIRDILTGQTHTALSSFAIGTGTNAPALADTGLQSSISYDGTNSYKEYLESSTASAQITLVGYISGAQANGNSLTETGLFSGLGITAGTMYNRITHNAIAKTLSLELRYEFTLQW